MQLNLLKNSSLVLGITFGILILYTLFPEKIEKNQFNEKALNNKNTVNLAVYKNNKIHCHYLKDLDDCIGDYKKNSNSKILVIWLGNSQLHVINQFTNGDETASKKLHKFLKKKGHYLFTFSQTN